MGRMGCLQASHVIRFSIDHVEIEALPNVYLSPSSQCTGKRYTRFLLIAIIRVNCVIIFQDFDKVSVSASDLFCLVLFLQP